MNIERRQTETYLLTEVPGLDPVTVYVTNFTPGKGKIVIECYGQAWAAYWSAMSGMTVQEFVLRSDADHLATKLAREEYQTDFDEINTLAAKRGHDDICVTTDFDVAMASKDMAACFGEHWLMELPRCNTQEYRYLCKILAGIKAAFQEDAEPESKVTPATRMKMEEKIAAAVKYMQSVVLNQGRDWFSPTEIGRAVGGAGKHSSYGSPICHKAVAEGVMERNKDGHYRLIHF